MAVKKKVSKPATKKTVVKKMVSPVVIDEPSKLFVDHSRRAFLLIKEGTGYNQYITTRDELIQVVKLEVGRAPVAENEAQMVRKNSETTHTGQLTEYQGPSNNLDTARLWKGSHLPKSPEAMAELCRLLGEPVPEVSTATRERRKAAGERLQAARAPRVGFTVQQLCEELKIDPADARKQLRKAKIEKPEAGWVWATKEDAMNVAVTAGLIEPKKPAKSEKKPVKVTGKKR